METTKLEDRSRLKLYYGLDTEFPIYGGSTRLLQLSFPHFVSEEHRAIVIDLHKVGVDSQDSCPVELRRLLQLDFLVACGVNIGTDAAKLRDFGISIETRDVHELARHHCPSENGYSMRELCPRYLKLSADKSYQSFDWTIEY